MHFHTKIWLMNEDAFQTNVNFTRQQQQYVLYTENNMPECTGAWRLLCARKLSLAICLNVDGRNPIHLCTINHTVPLGNDFFLFISVFHLAYSITFHFLPFVFFIKPLFIELAEEKYRICIEGGKKRQIVQSDFAPNQKLHK